MNIWSITIMPACSGCFCNHWRQVFNNSHCSAKWGTTHTACYPNVEAETLAEAIVAAKNLYELDYPEWRKLSRIGDHRGPIGPHGLFTHAKEQTQDHPA